MQLFFESEICVCAGNPDKYFKILYGCCHTPFVELWSHMGVQRSAADPLGGGKNYNGAATVSVQLYYAAQICICEKGW